MARQFFRRHIALTQEHGAWVFLFSPLLIGLFAGGWSPASGWLVLAALAAFLFKQPLTIAVKAFAGRRPRADLPAAYFWMAVYGLLLAAGYAGLARYGFAGLAWLALPGVPILLWHLRLVARREERRQIGLEIWASGALALAAPGAHWVGVGGLTQEGIWLWLLTWLQAAASLVYAALRLEQRDWTNVPGLGARARAGRRALMYAAFNLGAAFALGAGGGALKGIWLPFAIQWVEVLWGVWFPGVGLRPVKIGVRQLLVSALFTAAFIGTWG